MQYLPLAWWATVAALAAALVSVVSLIGSMSQPMVPARWQPVAGTIGWQLWPQAGSLVIECRFLRHFEVEFKP